MGEVVAWAYSPAHAKGGVRFLSVETGGIIVRVFENLRLGSKVRGFLNGNQSGLLSWELRLAGWRIVLQFAIAAPAGRV